MMAVYGLFQDLLIALWPMSIKVCYSPRLSPNFAWLSLAMAFILAALLLAAILAARKKRIEGLAGIWFFAGLLPVANLIPVDALAADRFLYAPLVGLSLLWGRILTHLKPLWAGGAACALGLLLSLKTLQQQQAWQNIFNLDLEAYHTAPRDPCTPCNLAIHYLNWGMLEKAENLLSQALSQDVPAHIRETALEYMGIVHLKAKRYREALSCFETVLKAQPDRQELRSLIRFCSVKANRS
jgi:tetratricopeptide (TPR) repeat protein